MEGNTASKKMCNFRIYSDEGNINSIFNEKQAHYLHNSKTHLLDPTVKKVCSLERFFGLKLLLNFFLNGYWTFIRFLICKCKKSPRKHN